MTNTDPKGFVRTVDEYKLGPAGLYLRRSMPGHPRLSHLQSWLVPSLDLRITEWGWNPGITPDSDYYVDIAGVETGERQWRTVDHYLDLAVHAGQSLDVLDTDELLGALDAGLIDTRTVQLALESAYRAVEGIARNRYDINSWLAELNMPLDWRQD
jgi:predicted RNA-binding protein associated with RNAse of E/G family